MNTLSHVRPFSHPRKATTAWIFIYSWDILISPHQITENRNTFLGQICVFMYPISNCGWRLATNNIFYTLCIAPAKTSTASLESNHKFMYIKLITMRTFRCNKKFFLKFISAQFVTLCFIEKEKNAFILVTRKLFDFFDPAIRGLLFLFSFFLCPPHLKFDVVQPTSRNHERGNTKRFKQTTSEREYYLWLVIHVRAFFFPHVYRFYFYFLRVKTEKNVCITLSDCSEILFPSFTLFFFLLSTADDWWILIEFHLHLHTF